MQDLPPIIAAVRDQLVDHVRPERIILFGSYAKGKQTRYSDIDVLAVTKAPVAPARQAIARQLFYDYPVRVDVLFCTNDRLLAEERRPYSFLCSIMKSCLTLYERRGG
jgi:predicted nucleotidyltransferase